MGNRGSGGLRDWGIGALGHWGIGKKWRNTRGFITGYLIRIKNSRKLLQCCFFWCDSILFPAPRRSHFRDVLHGFDNLFDVPR